MRVPIPIEISARHIHLCQNDLETLFGKGYCLTKKRALTQPGEFVAEETVAVIFGDKKIPRVRVISPLREQTQLEISLTDAYNLGMKSVVRSSGDLRSTPGILLIGPEGKLDLKQGVITAWRHLHISPEEAVELGIEEKKSVSVSVQGERALVFHNVKIRLGKNYKLALHLDTDEGNAAGVIGKTFGELMI